MTRADRSSRAAVVITSLAVGVAIFVAIVGSPASPAERVAAFHQGWWIFVAIVMLGLFPTFLLIRPKRL